MPRLCLRFAKQRIFDKQLDIPRLTAEADLKSPLSHQQVIELS